MNRALLLALSVWAMLPVAQSAAQKKDEPAARVEAIAPFLNAKTLSILHLNVRRTRGTNHFNEQSAYLAKLGIPRAKQTVYGSVAIDNFEKLPQVGVTDIFRVEADLSNDMALPPMGAGVPANDAPRPGLASFAVIPITAGSDPQEIMRLFPSGPKVDKPFVFNQFIVRGPPEIKSWLNELKPTPCPHLTPAFKAAGDTDMQYVLTPTGIVQLSKFVVPPGTAEELKAQFALLEQKTEWVVFTSNYAPKRAFAMILQMKDTESANRIRNAFVQDLASLSLRYADAIPNARMENLVSALTPTTHDTQLRIILTKANGGMSQVTEFYQMMIK